MSTIENATRHFAAKETKRIEVAEWGDESGPLVIYAEPLTLADKEKIVKKREQNQVLALAYVLIWFAKNEKGENIFTIEDKRALQFKVDPDVLARVATEILSGPDVDEVKKN